MNRYDEPSGLPTYDEPCILYDKDPPERRQTERVKLRGGERKPNRFRRLRALVRIDRNTGLWLLAMGLLFAAAYMALRAF